MKYLSMPLLCLAASCGPTKADQYFALCEQIASRQEAQGCLNVYNCGRAGDRVCEEEIEKFRCHLRNVSCVDGEQVPDLSEVCPVFACLGEGCQCTE